MRRKALICIEFPSEALLNIILVSLLPEALDPATSRSEVSIEGEGKKMMMRIEAKDTSALRATLNSYLRWIAVARDAYGAIADFERKTARQKVN